MFKLRLHALVIPLSVSFIIHAQEVTPLPEPTEAPQPTVVITEAPPPDPQPTVLPTGEITPAPTAALPTPTAAPVEPTAPAPTPTSARPSPTPRAEKKDEGASSSGSSQQQASSSSSQSSSTAPENRPDGGEEGIAQSISRQFIDFTASVGRGLMREKEYDYYGENLMSRQTSAMLLAASVVLMISGLFALNSRRILIKAGQYGDELSRHIPLPLFQKKKVTRYRRSP